MRNLPLLSFALLLVVASMGCLPPWTACTLEVLPSVTVSVVDGEGAPVPDADVVFVLDGAAPQPCQNLDDGTYLCGEEQAGTFEITARKDGFVDAGGTVEVPDGDCHVASQTLDLTLLPASS